MMPLLTTGPATSAFKRERRTRATRVRKEGKCWSTRETRGEPERQERTGPGGRRERQAAREPKAHKDLKERRGPQVRPERQVRRERQERQVRQDWCGKGRGAARPRMR